MVSSFVIYCLVTVKWVKLLLSNTNSFICSQLNGSQYCCVILIIQFNISYLFARS